MRAFFGEKGYLDTKVDIREIRDSSYANREILEIIVDKQERIKVGRINFIGNNSLPASKLRRAMKDTKEKALVQSLHLFEIPRRQIYR